MSTPDESARKFAMYAAGAAAGWAAISRGVKKYEQQLMLDNDLDGLRRLQVARRDVADAIENLNNAIDRVVKGKP